MYVVERTQYYCEGDGKQTLIAETKEKLIQELEGCFIDWYEPSEYSPEDYPDIDRIGIRAVKDDNWEEGDWYDWEFDPDYLLSLEGDKIIEFFNRLSSEENFTLLYAKEGS